MKEVLLQLLPNMTLWKLNSGKEYVVFLLLLMSGWLLFHFWIGRIKKARTPEGARKRILKSVKSAAKKNCRFFIPSCPSASDSGLWIVLDRDILLLKIFPKGYRVYCSDRNERWKLYDNSSRALVMNPLPKLKEMEERLLKRCADAKITGLHVHTFAVFGDNYAEPEVHLDEETAKQVFSTRTLAAWVKARKPGPLPAKKMNALEKVLNGLAKEAE